MLLYSKAGCAFLDILQFSIHLCTASFSVDMHTNLIQQLVMSLNLSELIECSQQHTEMLYYALLMYQPLNLVGHENNNNNNVRLFDYDITRNLQ